jgi:8-oxo-dGTP pyrophosphatase MutT (NUDIX family)
MEEIKHLDDLGRTHLCSECYVIKDDKVLLFKRSETASKFPGYWIGPGGHVDSNDDAVTAAIREMKEEAGVEIELNEIKLKGIALPHHIDRGEVWVSFIFLATISENQIEKSEDIEGKAKWIDLKSLETMDNIFPPSKYYFDHVLKDKPGIMYTNIEWSGAQLVKVLNQTVDANG